MSASTRTAPSTWGTSRIGVAFAAITLAVVLAVALVFIALSAVAPASNIGTNSAAGSLSSTNASGTMYDRRGADAVVSKGPANEPASAGGARGLRPQ